VGAAGAHRAGGRRAQPDRAATGMPVPSALPLRHRDLRAGGAAAGRARPGSPGRLPSPPESHPGNGGGGRVTAGGPGMTADEGTIEVPGGRVWYRSVGEGGTPLLCLHGGPGFTHYYLEPLEALAGRRQVIFYDQLGCGRSDRPDDASLWTVEPFLEELAQGRAAAGLDR